jgi:hypothetical protein
VGLLATMGLAAKNAILIVEFAEAETSRGSQRPRSGATTPRGCVLRPILMTSFAFIAGVFPLVVRACGRCQPERHRHRRGGRHVHRCNAGDLLRAGVLRHRPPPRQAANCLALAGPLNDVVRRTFSRTRSSPASARVPRPGARSTA